MTGTQEAVSRIERDAEALTEAEPTAKKSTEADFEALRELVRRWDAAIKTGNLEALMALMTVDVVRMPPGSCTYIGKEATRSRVESFFAKNNYELRDTVEDIQITGDSAFMRMSFTLSSTPKEGGKTTVVAGKGVVVVKRQEDGEWRVSTEIWNLNDSNGRSLFPWLNRRVLVWLVAVELVALTIGWAWLYPG